MTSYIVVLQKIIDTTQARPSKRGLDDFKKAVIDVLFEEKSAYYEGLGYYLDVDGPWIFMSPSFILSFVSFIFTASA